MTFPSTMLIFDMIQITLMIAFSVMMMCSAAIRMRGREATTFEK